MGLNPTFKRHGQSNFLTHSSIVALVFGGALLGSVPAFAVCGIQGGALGPVTCAAAAGGGDANVTITSGSTITAPGTSAIRISSADGSSTVRLEGATVTSDNGQGTLVTTAAAGDASVIFAGTNNMTLNGPTGDTVVLVMGNGAGAARVTVEEGSVLTLRTTT